MYNRLELVTLIHVSIVDNLAVLGDIFPRGGSNANNNKMAVVVARSKGSVAKGAVVRGALTFPVRFFYLLCCSNLVIYALLLPI